MAMLSSFDELNNMSLSEVSKTKDTESINKFFDEMELTEDEIEARKQLAYDIYDILFGLFILIKSVEVAGFEHNPEYYKDYLANKLDVVFETTFNTEEHSSLAREFAEDIVDTTMKHIPATLVPTPTTVTPNQVPLKPIPDNIKPKPLPESIKPIPVKPNDKDYWVSPNRATTDAENMANVVSNADKHRKAIEEGYTLKQWITKHDRRVRHTHEIIDFETIDINEYFSVGLSEMLYPCDLENGSMKEIANCRCVVKYLNKKAKSTTDNQNVIISGAKITNPDSKESEEFARNYYLQIRKMTFDVEKISQNIGIDKNDILKIKRYLFLDKNWTNPITKEKDYFTPDCAIAQSWQRLKDNNNIQPHDITLIKHELEEMRIKEENPNISHIEAHMLANKKYNYQKEADDYYGNLR